LDLAALGLQAFAHVAIRPFNCQEPCRPELHRGLSMVFRFGRSARIQALKKDLMYLRLKLPRVMGHRQIEFVFS
jgi:hypothetical protein